MRELFLAELTATGVQRTRVTSERRSLGCQFVLRGNSIVVYLSLEPALVAHLARRVLGQPSRIDSGAPLGGASTGAAMAILSEVARRTARLSPLTPDFSHDPLGQPGPVALGTQRALGLDFWLRLDGVSYAGFAAVASDGGGVQSSPPPETEEQSTLPVGLRLIFARCELSGEDYHSLCQGDVVIPAEAANLSWLAKPSRSIRIPDGIEAWLCSPGAHRGLLLSARGGKLCLAGVVNLSYEAAVTSKQAPGVDANPGGRSNSPADVIMDAPVVVHLELGSVTLSAQSWLGLRVGDVVCSELPVGRPIALRVAERTVAEGELVSVDGQVGVRIVRFFKA